MTETAFAELTRKATALDYTHRITLLNSLAQSLYKDEIPQYENAMNGLDEAIAQVERGEVEVFDTFDDFKAAMQK